MMRAAFFICLLPGICFAQVFADDVEGVGLLPSDNPPGRWDFPVARPSAQILVHAGAAHRGDAGIRFIDDDTTIDPNAETTTMQLSKSFAFDGGQRDWYVRFWFRLTQVQQTGAEIWIGEQYGRRLTIDKALAQVRITGPGRDGGTFLDGHVDLNGFQENLGLVEVGDGGWHLVEINLRHIGLPSGNRTLFVDGQQSATADVDLTSYEINTVTIGEVYGRTIFRGVLDYDDIRVSNSPQASLLHLGASGLPASFCNGMDVSLRSSVSAQLAPAPYPVAVVVTSSEPTDQLFSDVNCTLAGVPAIAAGANGTPFFVKTQTDGVRTLFVSHPDFLPDDISFLGAAPPDAGVDAGAPDAGTADAGADAGGETDAGVDPDAGVADDAGTGLDAGTFGGPEASEHVLLVGCGCGALPEGAALLCVFAVCAYVSHRRRRT